MVREFWAEMIAATATGLGYALLYNVKGRLLIPSFIGAAFGWAAYSLSARAGMGAVWASFMGAVMVSLWAEIFSRRCKSPATVFLIVGVLPLVPGAGIYNTMLDIVNRHYTEAKVVGLQTLGIALALALGILVVTSFGRLFNYFKARLGFPSGRP